jgi:alkaline phosphatase
MLFNKYLLPLFSSIALIYFNTKANAQEYKIHSHNDYLRKIPFWEAVSANAISIEVDVILLRDTLFVAHEKEAIRTNRTFENLYLEPLRQADNLSISLPPSLQLLVDCKTEANSTLASIIKKCENYRQILYQPETGKGVKIIVSGNRPPASNYKDSPPYLFFDHQSLDDLETISFEKVGMISLPFYKYIKWNGKDSLPAEEKEKVMKITQLVHRYHVPFRFWATPDTPEAWKMLPELGIDFINTDQPSGVSAFLTRNLK